MREAWEEGVSCQEGTIMASHQVLTAPLYKKNTHQAKFRWAKVICYSASRNIKYFTYLSLFLASIYCIYQSLFVVDLGNLEKLYSYRLFADTKCRVFFERHMGKAFQTIIKIIPLERYHSVRLCLLLIYCTLQRQNTEIRNKYSRPQSHFPYSCVCERFIHIPTRGLPILLQENI